MSLAVSVALHAAVVLLIVHFMRTFPARVDDVKVNIFRLDVLPEDIKPIPAPVIEEEVVTPPPVALEPEPPPIDVVPPRQEEEEPVVPPLVQPTDIPAGIPAPGSATGVPGTGEPARPRTGAERFQRTIVNPEFWAPPAPGPPPTPEEQSRARIATGIRQYNDSIAAAVADAQRATDWTKTDADGNKWGVSPGKLHLGSVTIPLPFAFSGPPGRREEVAARNRNWSEAQAQAARVELDETFQSRVKAIRARKDAERDSARAAKKSGGN